MVVPWNSLSDWISVALVSRVRITRVTTHAGHEHGTQIREHNEAPGNRERFDAATIQHK